MTVTAEPERVLSQRVATRRGLVERRILVFVAILISALTLRVAVTAFTPLALRISDEIGFSHSIVGIFGMVPPAMFAVFGLLTPTIARRLGLERTALLAMAMAGFGMLARAVVSDVWSLLFLSALALGGMGIGNVVVPPLVKRYFSDRLAVMSTIYITMVQLGTVAPALVAVPVAEANGWRISIGMWALLGLTAMLPWLLILRNRRDDGLEHVTKAAEPRGKIWRSPVAWGLAGMFGVTSLITYTMFTWIPAILTDAGASAAFGGSMVGLFALIGLVSAFGAPTLVARVSNPFPVVVGCAVAYLIAFTGLLIAPMSAPIVWVLILGLGPSTFPMALTLINLRTRTQIGSASLSGFTQGLGYAIACLGPLLFGVLHDATSDWVVPFAFLTVAVVIVVIAGWFACKPRMLEDTW
ncbi:CynX/NimT family MFS transporter [Antrihabitans spumae]|jgi:MFS transporter, CP family, cyanate transporter|uniref:CynX/NimT family MFS transporter n=1 Tax=Antrihabitans spumae TaxID=3373370 RepID=A0ABW7JV36_9NOCA